MSTFFKTDATIIGGTINNTSIGNTSPSSAVFTTLTATNGVNLDTISSIINIGAGTTGAINIGSVLAGAITISSGGNIGLDTAALFSYVGSTVTGIADGAGGLTLNSTESTATTHIGSDGTGGVLIDAANATGTVDITASGGGTIDIGTDSGTSIINIGTGTGINASGVIIGRSGVTTTISGDLNIAGTITSINQVNLAVANNNILLNDGYVAETPINGYLIVNVDPDVAGSQTTIATGAFTGTTTVNVTDASPFLVGDFIVITGANTESNNAFYAITSTDIVSIPNSITIKTTTNVGSLETSFVVDSVVAGLVTRTTLNILNATPTGDWRIGIDDNDNDFTFNVLEVANPTSERLVFSTGISNNITPTIDASHFTLLHSTGTISGSVGAGLVDGFKKSIVCDSFPNADGISVFYDLTVSPFQNAGGDQLTDRVFRFNRAGQSASLIWHTIPKTVNIYAVAQASLSDNEYFDINSADDAAAYRFWFDVSGVAVGPAAGGRTLVKVDVSVDVTASDVASTIASVVDAVNGGNDFEAATTRTNNTIIAVVCTAYTLVSTTDAAESVANAGFMVASYDGTWLNPNAGIELVPL